MKKTPTKILSTVLSFLMIISAVSVSASAKSEEPKLKNNSKISETYTNDDEDFDFDDPLEYIETVVKNHVVYDLFSDYTATAYAETEYDEEYEALSGLASGDITIPSVIKYQKENYTVNAIGDFSCCDDLKSVTLPDTIRYIEDSAFMECGKLKDVVIPQSCEFDYVGSCLFSFTPFGDSLDKKDVVILGKNALYSFNGSDESYTVPENITIICENAFMCTNIKSITFPSNLDSIDNYAFSNCINLSEINIPDSVTYIGEGSFIYCSSLKKITLGEGLEVIGCDGFTGTAIESINIPASLSECTGAFRNCEKLSEFTVDKDNESFFTKDGVLYSSYSDCDLETGEEFTFTSLVAYPIAKADLSYVVPFTIDTISSGAFSGAKNLKSIDLSKSDAVSVLDYSFADSSIQNINFDKIDLISDYAFAYCKNIKEADLSTVDFIIGESAFQGCENLAEVTLSDEIGYIGSYAFSETAIKDITVYGDECQIGGGAFSSCPNLKEVNLGNGVYYIGERLFGNCPSLETVTLSKTIIFIDDYTFDDCENVLFKVIKRSEAYKAVKADNLNYEIIGSIPLITIIFGKMMEFFRNIFPWI